jgi:hypothetical protein
MLRGRTSCWPRLVELGQTCRLSHRILSVLAAVVTCSEWPTRVARYAHPARRLAGQRSQAVTRVLHRRRLHGRRDRRRDGVSAAWPYSGCRATASSLSSWFTTRREAVDLGTGINHLVVQVESLEETLADLATHGIAAEAPALPADPATPRTSWITDPDGYRIERVESPTAQADGVTETDFA